MPGCNQARLFRESTILHAALNGMNFLELLITETPDKILSFWIFCLQRLFTFIFLFPLLRSVTRSLSRNRIVSQVECDAPALRSQVSSWLLVVADQPSHVFEPPVSVQVHCRHPIANGCMSQNVTSPVYHFHFGKQSRAISCCFFFFFLKLEPRYGHNRAGGWMPTKKKKNKCKYAYDAHSQVSSFFYCRSMSMLNVCVCESWGEHCYALCLLKFNEVDDAFTFSLLVSVLATRRRWHELRDISNRKPNTAQNRGIPFLIDLSKYLTFHPYPP